MRKKRTQTCPLVKKDWLILRQTLFKTTIMNEITLTIYGDYMETVRTKQPLMHNFKVKRKTVLTAF